MRFKEFTKEEKSIIKSALYRAACDYAALAEKHPSMTKTFHCMAITAKNLSDEAELELES